MAYVRRSFASLTSSSSECHKDLAAVVASYVPVLTHAWGFATSDLEVARTAAEPMGGTAATSASGLLKVVDAIATAAMVLESSTSSSKARLALVCVKRPIAASEDLYGDTAKLQALKQ